MKRVICGILSVFMLISVLSIGAVNVSASSLTASDGAIDMLKQFEGFHATAYPDNGQYSIGYGTSCDPSDYPDGITEEKAEELLKAAVASCETAVNALANKHGLTFNQGQFDALVLFGYNLGAEWYKGQEDGTLYNAIVGGATGNDFIFAMTLWCKASNTIHTGLVSRRLAEANLYLNGVYSKTPPANYSYVIFNGNGGESSASIQGYDASGSVAIKATATYSGYYFDGWYTAKEGGNKVTSLDASTKGLTLYAQWQENEPIATGKVTASSLYVRASADPSSAVVGGLQNNTEVDIYEIVSVGGTKWGRVDNGWICLTYVDWQMLGESSDEEDTETPGTGDSDTEATDPTEPDTVIATGTVTVSGALTIRKGPGTGYGIAGYYANGDKVEIYEMDITGSTTWGRTDKGWIALTYVKLDEAVEEEPEDATDPSEDATDPSEDATDPSEDATDPSEDATDPSEDATDPSETPDAGSEPVAKGVVTGTVYLRKAAGANGGIIGSIPYGTEVSLIGLKIADGIVWGQTEDGWISLNYVRLTAPIDATVTCGLNIRSGAGTNNGVVGSYGANDRVKIYETKTVNNAPWGRTDRGWISLNYVTLDGVSADDTTAETPETPDSGETTDTVLATGTVTAAGALTIRRGPGSGYGIVGYYANGDRVTILEMDISGSTTWGRTDRGWISLSFVKLDTTVVVPPTTEPEETEPSEDATEPSEDATEPSEEATEPEATEPETPATDDSIASGTVTATSLSVRSAASAKAAVKKTVSYGTAVKIYDLQIADGILWGQTEDGWISMNYVKLNQPLSAEITASGLYIRPKAGSYASSLGMYVSGDKVSIYETKTVSGAPWGRTDRGWINLKYVEFAASAESTVTPETPETPDTPATDDVITTGTITANSLSVRSGGSSASAIIGTVSLGTEVTIYELKLSDGILWGRMDQGWISMNYVKVQVSLTGTITASTLNIRAKAGYAGTVVGSCAYGDTVVIYETATANGLAWGLTNKGWISLKYVQLDA